VNPRSTRRLRSVTDVVERQMCTGCGACAYYAPEALRMTDVLDHGRRPVSRPGADPRRLEQALDVCPGVGLERESHEVPRDALPGLLAAWGPVLEIWEGYAADPELRFAASSGGAASALALHAIEVAGMHGLLHIAARQDIPYLNRTVLSRTREELMAATGSRYAPASPCDGLDLIESAPGACV